MVLLFKDWPQTMFDYTTPLDYFLKTLPEAGLTGIVYFDNYGVTGGGNIGQPNQTV